MKENFGQAAVETPLVFAAALAILLVLVSFTSQQFNYLQQQRAVKTAQSSMDQLVSAINEVYAQGPGATKQRIS